MSIPCLNKVIIIIIIIKNVFISRVSKTLFLAISGKFIDNPLQIRYFGFRKISKSIIKITGVTCPPPPVPSLATPLEARLAARGFKKPKLE